MRHVLLTNDFPPKIGGIQSYLYELWRRLPEDEFTVLTSKSHPDVDQFDADQDFTIERQAKWLTPSPRMLAAAKKHIKKHNIDFAVVDPAIPLGVIGPKLGVPYAVVLHGAEVTVPARLPVLSGRMKKVLLGASAVISAGEYAANEARRIVGDAMPPTTIIPPGVDLERFKPISDRQRVTVRNRWVIPRDVFVIVAHSRLVKRKGFDYLIKAVNKLNNDNVQLLIVGSGRDRPRLERIAEHTSAHIRFLGRVPDAQLPQLIAAADLSAMLCHKRWFGLEQEGFGIVFLEAAACGIPQLAGLSGGSAEAVVEGETGLVVEDASKIADVTRALRRLVDEPDTRQKMATASRQRAEEMFNYDNLAATLREALAACYREGPK